MRAADPGERALVAQQRVELAALAREDLPERGRVDARARPGPRCARSASTCSGVASQTPARFFFPASVSTSSAPSSKRSRNAGVFGPFAPGAR